MHNILVRDRVLATMEDGVGIKTRFLPKNIQSLLHRPSVDRFPHCDAMGLIEVIQTRTYQLSVKDVFHNLHYVSYPHNK